MRPSLSWVSLALSLQIVTDRMARVGVLATLARSLPGTQVEGIAGDLSETVLTEVEWCTVGVEEWVVEWGKFLSLVYSLTFFAAGAVVTWGRAEASLYTLFKQFIVVSVNLKANDLPLAIYGFSSHHKWKAHFLSALSPNWRKGKTFCSI